MYITNIALGIRSELEMIKYMAVYVCTVLKYTIRVLKSGYKD